MPFPPFLLRRTSYREAESAGQDLSTANMDAEQNDQLAAVNEINRRLRLITDVTGRLINIASQISQALVGAERFTITVPQTVFTTTITWDSNFSNLNVLVLDNGVAVDTDTVAVADNAGFLEVTLDTAIASGWALVAAYSEGAGIEARLIDTGDVLNGAAMIGVYDVDGNFVSVNVEGALAELASAIDTLNTELGTIGEIWTANGGSIDGGDALDDFRLGGFKITGLGDGVDAQDAVTLAQLQAYTQNIASVIALFIRADGAVEFTADQSMGGFKLVDVGTPTDPTDAANKQYVDDQDELNRLDSVAPDGLKDSTARGTMTGPLTFGQTATASADADQTSTPGTVVVPTLLGLAKPSTADQAANKQYVDEQIADALGAGSSARSPYAVWALPRPAYGTDTQTLDGALTNITAGGVFMGTGLTITVPQTIARDTHIFIDGDVTISAAITGTGKIFEISATGDVTISAAIGAQDIRIRAGGTVHIATGGVLTAGSLVGVITLDSLADIIVEANLNALLVFVYAVTELTMSATVRARGGRNNDSVQWGSAYWNLAADYGRTPVDLLSFGYDYMTRYAGAIGLQGTGGAGSGGGGAVAGGRGRARSSSGSLVGNVSAGRGIDRPYLLPAAPGGPAGAGDGTIGAQDDVNYGGGVIVVVCTGNAVLTGATLDASGQAAGSGSTGSGGGGGTVKVCVRGTLTDGTYDASGGTGLVVTGSNDGGGGGGGTAYCILAAVAAGVQVYDVAGGENGNSGISGENGVSGTVVLSGVTQWDTLRAQGFFDR